MNDRQKLEKDRMTQTERTTDNRMNDKITTDNEKEGKTKKEKVKGYRKI